jgi:alkylation response protein AidB-like acyl-CoA dehydrogenase
VANAPIAALFAVVVKIPGQAVPKVLLVPADAPGITVRAHEKPWPHGCGGTVTFKDCQVPVGNLLGDNAAALLACVDVPGDGTLPSDTPGFRIGKVFNKSGWRFYQNGEMIFENARVPHANVVGEVNGAVRKTGAPVAILLAATCSVTLNSAPMRSAGIIHVASGISVGHRRDEERTCMRRHV